MSERGGNAEIAVQRSDKIAIPSLAMSSRSPLAFGPFVLDFDRSELLRDGVPVKLAPQPFAVLTALLAQPGTLVTRDELRQTLWGDETFVDYNAGLNFCVAQLRAALGDPASQSTFIAAVPRRGYRFVGEIRALNQPVPADPPTVARPKSRVRP